MCCTVILFRLKKTTVVWSQCLVKETKLLVEPLASVIKALEVLMSGVPCHTGLYSNPHALYGTIKKTECCLVTPASCMTDSGAGLLFK